MLTRFLGGSGPSNMVPGAWGGENLPVTHTVSGTQASRLPLHPEVRPSLSSGLVMSTGLLPEEQAAVPGSCMTLGSVIETQLEQPGLRTVPKGRTLTFSNCEARRNKACDRAVVTTVRVSVSITTGWQRWRSHRVTCAPAGPALQLPAPLRLAHGLHCGLHSLLRAPALPS